MLDAGITGGVIAVFKQIHFLLFQDGDRGLKPLVFGFGLLSARDASAKVDDQEQTDRQDRGEDNLQT
jgi:hypothetical protein